MTYSNSGAPYDVYITSLGGDYVNLGRTIGAPKLLGINERPCAYTATSGGDLTITWAIPDDENILRVRRRLRRMPYREFMVKRFDWRRFALLYRMACAGAEAIRKEVDQHILMTCLLN